VPAADDDDDEEDESEERRSSILEASNALLVNVVFKLTETQLRPLYAALRQWRGEILMDGDEDEEDEAAVVSTVVGDILKRESFWKGTSALCSSLRSIFLPCVTTVVGDAGEELSLAVAQLCGSKKRRSAAAAREKKSKSKRRKVDEKEKISNDEEEEEMLEKEGETILVLEPLLLSLQTALKADAHEGGSWTRENEGERFKLLLNPLRELLCDAEFENADDYERVVRGINAEDGSEVEGGSVAGAIVALAAASGNELLWKPLNHAILKACGSAERVEVRRAGVGILLEVVRNIGEEDLVLLPECLPVLAELLEESDEDILKMTREIMRITEELTGESMAELMG
jgi:hypothetical protein